MIRAAAALDPAGGRIIGFALSAGGRPARARLLLDGAPMAEIVAAMSAVRLGAAGFAALGAPPTAACAFEARLPKTAAGRLLVVEALAPGAAAATVLTHEFDDPRALARYREGAVMADSATISNLRLRGGVFRARLEAPGGAAPEIALKLRGETRATADCAPRGGGVFDLAVAAPAEMFDDGVLVAEFAAADGSVLARYPVAAGVALPGDLAAEVGALRAELDLLKRAFREAMAGGVLRRDERPMIVAEALAEVDHLLEMRDRADSRAARAAPVDDGWDDDGAWEVDE